MKHSWIWTKSTGRKPNCGFNFCVINSTIKGEFQRYFGGIHIFEEKIPFLQVGEWVLNYNSNLTYTICLWSGLFFMVSAKVLSHSTNIVNNTAYNDILNIRKSQLSGESLGKACSCSSRTPAVSSEYGCDLFGFPHIVAMQCVWQPNKLDCQ